MMQIVSIEALTAVGDASITVRPVSAVVAIIVDAVRVHPGACFANSG